MKNITVLISSFLGRGQRWRLVALVALFFVAGCTVELYPPVQEVSNLPDGGKVDVLPDTIPDEFAFGPRIFWSQIVASDSAYSIAVTDANNKGRWLDSLRWVPGGPFVTVNGDTLSTRSYARDNSGVTGDNQLLTYNGSGSLTIEDGNTVDMSDLLDNTDDQAIDTFSLSGTTLSLSLESDGQAAKTVDLSALAAIDSTRLTQDSILVYYQDGAEVGRDTITGTGGGGVADNLGNHTMTQNLQTNSNWISGDGGNEGIGVDADGKVGIGTLIPSYILDINSTNAVRLPVGTTAQRPTGATGLLRYNSDLTSFEGYYNAQWNRIVDYNAISTGGILNINQYSIPYGTASNGITSSKVTWDGVKTLDVRNSSNDPGGKLVVEDYEGRLIHDGGLSLYGASNVGYSTIPNMWLKSGRTYMYGTLDLAGLTSGLDVGSNYIGSNGWSSFGSAAHTMKQGYQNGSEYGFYIGKSNTGWSITDGLDFLTFTASGALSNTPPYLASDITNAAMRFLGHAAFNTTAYNTQSDSSVIYTGSQFDLPYALYLTQGDNYLAGKLGLGQITPTAALHLPAGTATAGTASMKIPDGTLLATPEAGAVEVENGLLYYTQTTPVTRKQIAYVDTDDGSASDTTDGSGDITVSHTLGSASITVNATATGTSFYNVQIHTKTSTTFKIRFFDATGAAVTATAVTADWIAKLQ